MDELIVCDPRQNALVSRSVRKSDGNDAYNLCRLPQLFKRLSRYERDSILLTSNLAFNQRECILKDPMTTGTFIDCLMHHRVIPEVNVPSYWLEAENEIQSADGSTS